MSPAIIGHPHARTCFLGVRATTATVPSYCNNGKCPSPFSTLLQPVPPIGSPYPFVLLLCFSGAVLPGCHTKSSPEHTPFARPCVQSRVQLVHPGTCWHPAVGLSAAHRTFHAPSADEAQLPSPVIPQCRVPALAPCRQIKIPNCPIWSAPYSPCSPLQPLVDTGSPVPPSPPTMTLSADRRAHLDPAHRPAQPYNQGHGEVGLQLCASPQPARTSQVHPSPRAAAFFRQLPAAPAMRSSARCP